MSIVKKVGVLVSALLLTAGIEAAQAADMPRIAVVNVQQVLQQSTRVAEVSKKLEGKFKKESPTMSQKDKDNMQKKIADDRAELVKKVVAYQQDLQKEQNQAMQGILNSLNSVVSDIAKKDNYGLVLDSQAVIFSIDNNDITKDVAKKFNG